MQARQVRRIYHSIIWATLVVAWLVLNPFFGLGAPRAQDVGTSEQVAAPEVTEEIEPGLPVSIEIPKIEVKAKVQQVGNDRNGNVGIPNNFIDVAWYNRGPLPGAAGAALVVGHVNDRFAAPAVFADLRELEPGDLITVADDRGQNWIFEVEEKATYPYKDFPEEKIFGPYSEARLHLITCIGTWLQTERSYDRRLIVFARLISAD